MLPYDPYFMCKHNFTDVDLLKHIIYPWAHLHCRQCMPARELTEYSNKPTWLILVPASEIRVMCDVIWCTERNATTFVNISQIINGIIRIFAYTTIKDATNQCSITMPWDKTAYILQGRVYIPMRQKAFSEISEQKLPSDILQLDFKAISSCFYTKLNWLVSLISFSYRHPRKRIRWKFVETLGEHMRE